MNTKQDDGGSAFPIPYGQVMSDDGRGMSLRDWFAGMALQGWLASWSSESKHPVEVEKAAKLVASNSYAMADAMIAARKEGIK